MSKPEKSGFFFDTDTPLHINILRQSLTHPTKKVTHQTTQTTHYILIDYLHH